MDVMGKDPISKPVYLSGKLSAYVAASATFVQFFGYNLRFIEIGQALSIGALALAAIGALISIVAGFNLGDSLRFGLPSEKTKFKTKGLYKYSRNPMYLGFFLITIGAMLYTANPIITLLGAYGIYVHYLITISEEKFLKDRFGQEYINYFKRTRRYL